MQRCSVGLVLHLHCTCCCRGALPGLLIGHRTTSAHGKNSCPQDCSADVPDMACARRCQVVRQAVLHAWRPCVDAKVAQRAHFNIRAVGSGRTHALALRQTCLTSVPKSCNAAFSTHKIPGRSRASRYRVGVADYCQLPSLALQNYQNKWWDNRGGTGTIGTAVMKSDHAAANHMAGPSRSHLRWSGMFGIGLASSTSHVPPQSD